MATAIIGVAIVLLGYFFNSFKVTRQAQMDTQAQAFARSYFDSIRARWNTVSAYQTATQAPTSSDLGAPQGYSYSVQPTSFSSNDTLRTLQLTITNPDGRTLAFSSQVVRPTE